MGQFGTLGQARLTRLSVRLGCRLVVIGALGELAVHRVQSTPPP